MCNLRSGKVSLAPGPSPQINQVHFSVLQRKLLAPDDFEGSDELAEQILAFGGASLKIHAHRPQATPGTHQTARLPCTRPTSRMNPTNWRGRPPDVRNAACITTCAD